MDIKINRGDDMLLATLPAVHLAVFDNVANERIFDACRINTGARTPHSPEKNLETIISKIGKEKTIVDLKGRQLRIMQWAVPTFGDIILNHEISMDLSCPAEIIFRGNDRSKIVTIDRNRIYVDPYPREAVGAGQAVNVHGHNLKIFGYLTKEDKKYIKAAVKLGVHKYMLSFVEQLSDVQELSELDLAAEIYLKIESPKGLEFVRNEYPAIKQNVRLVAALDDMYINIGEDKTAIFDALDLIITSDPEAIAASRILTSLETSEIVSMQDLLSLRYLESIGYRSFMLSDGLCSKTIVFERAVRVLKQYFERKKIINPP